MLGTGVIQVMRAVGDAVLRAFRRNPRVSVPPLTGDSHTSTACSGTTSLAPADTVILKFRPGTAAHHEALQRIETSGTTQPSPPAKRPRRQQQVGATTKRRSALQDILVQASAGADDRPLHTNSGSHEDANSSSSSTTGAQTLLQHWDRFSFEKSGLSQEQGRSQPSTATASSSRSVEASSSSVQQLFQTWENPVNSRQASSVLQLFSSANPLQSAHTKLTKDMLKTATVVGTACTFGTLPTVPQSSSCLLTLSALCTTCRSG